MGIKKIKKENDLINLNIIEMLGNVDPSKTKKYTQFLVKMLNTHHKNEMLHYNRHRNREQDNIENLLSDDNVGDWITKRIVSNLFGYQEINVFIEFCLYMERGLVNEKDISKYDSWEMLSTELYVAKNKDLFKKAKKEIKVVYEDERFFCIKPLTYESSISYGYKTKWCTASVHEPSYFYNHSREGVLIYVIDKLKNTKFGFYNNGRIQIYNEIDDRIDSIETGIPSEIIFNLINGMKEDFKNGNYNSTLFSLEELKKMNSYSERRNHHIEQTAIDRYEEEPVPIEVMMDLPTSMDLPYLTSESTTELGGRYVNMEGDDLP